MSENGTDRDLSAMPHFPGQVRIGETPRAHAAEMDANEWNTRHPIGTPVVVTLHDGRRVDTRTTAPATMYGAFHMIRVESHKGLVLLAWVAPAASTETSAGSAKRRRR